jgi:hypothetical protein
MHRFATCVAALCLVLSSVLWAAEPEESWYGVYMGENKLGYVHVTTQDKEYQGQPAVYSQSEFVMKLQMMGQSTGLEQTGDEYQTKDGRPLCLNMTMSSMGRSTKVEAKFTEDSVTYTADLQGNVKTATLTLKPGQRFLTDPSEGGVVDTDIKVGDTISGVVFEPTTQQLLDMTIRVAAEEKIGIRGVDYEAYKIESKSSLADATTWVTKDGDMLKTVTLMNITIVKEPKEIAIPPKDYKPPKDFLFQTTIKMDKPIANPRGLTKLECLVTGFSRPLQLADDDVQSTKVTKAGEEAYEVLFDVHITKPSDAPEVKIADIDKDKYAEYLKPTQYVNSDDPLFATLAKEIVGDETVAWRAADLISHWCNQYLTGSFDISLIRHAKDIYESKKGVCRDYSTLMAAIARAARIPTKLCVGVVYFDSPTEAGGEAVGQFGYHAWVECWVGKWIAYEPTLGTSFVDATHLKFAGGDITSVFDVVKDFGKFEIHVLSSE